MAANTLSRYPVGIQEPDDDDTGTCEELEALGVVVAALTAALDDVIAMDLKHIKSAAQSDEQYQLPAHKVSSANFAAT